MPGHFEKAMECHEAYEVQMNEILFVPFVAESTVLSVGTANLNSCTVVMVVSEHGAILAHIAPRQDTAIQGDLNAGAQYAARAMDAMGDVYNQKNDHFLAPTASWIISARYCGGIALPSQVAVIESRLRKLGLRPSSASYNVVQSPLADDGKGTVFVDARKGGFPDVYVEDKLI